VHTSITRIGAGRRVGLKNSRDCDDQILKRRNGDNSAAGAARTYRFLRADRPAENGQKPVIGMPN